MSFEAAMQGEDNIRKGPWFEEEDELLTSFVTLLGDRRWDSIAKASGLRRSGKSCRLRWKNYLRPNLKRGNITAEEERIILQLHAKWGNKWSRIAQSLAGRTDNEIKNYWRTHLKKKEPAADQEQENKMDKATPSSQEYYSNSQHKFIEDMLRTSQNNAEGSSNLTSSGTKFPDWISELSNDQSFEHYGDSNCIESIDSSLCYSDMFSDNNNIHLWDYSCSLWDIV